MKVWSWRQCITKSDLTSTTKLVLMVLSTYMNDHGEGCYPSQDQIAKDASLTTRAVIKHLDIAIENGWLVKKKRNLTGKKWDSNEYEASTPSQYERGSDQNEGVNTVHPIVDNHDLRGEYGSGEGCTTFTQGVNHVHTNSPENSPMNSSPQRVDENADDEALVKIFDEELVKVFGFSRKAMRKDDRKYAQAYLKDGVTGEFFRAIVRDKLDLLCKADLSPPTGLVYFRDIVPEAISMATLIDGKPYHDNQQRPAQKPIKVTLETLGGDTPENHGLLKLMDKLQTTYGDSIFRSWIAPLRVKNKNCTAMTLLAPTRFHAEWIKTHYINDIEKFAGQIWPGITRVEMETRA